MEFGVLDTWFWPPLKGGHVACESTYSPFRDWMEIDGDKTTNEKAEAAAKIRDAALELIKDL